MRIRFLTNGASSAIGAFDTGDIANVSPDLAKHLVEEAKCAEYAEAKASAPTRQALDEALAGLPGSNTDPEYVVSSMRSFFGKLFTDADEAAVRAAVKAPLKKASDGLTVPQLKDALTAKGIAIPDGAHKPDLVKLLDEAT